MGNPTKGRDTVAAGTHYEHVAAKLLRAHGFDVKHHSEIDKPGTADIFVDGSPVEVKGSKLYRYNGRSLGYGFNIYCSGKSDNVRETFIVLVCMSSPPRAFIVPSFEATDAHFIAIPNKNPGDYKGKWAKYFEAYNLMR